MEFKPNKQPVGIHSERKKFKTHKVQLKAGDLLYIFTDGFADQFGGPQGKKFKSSKLKELFLNIYKRNMDAQEIILTETFESWKGNLEQVDDICIIGVRV